MTTIKLKNGSGAPTAGDLVTAEPALDLTNKRLYTEDSGGTVIEVGTNPGTDVTFADNRKAIFGAGSDLQLYHSGSHSYIIDNGTGDLKIYGANIEIGNASGVKNLFATSGGATTLYFNNAAKLATTSTGIDVTGTVTADGLTVDGKVLINTPTSAIAQEIRGRSSNDVGYLQFSNNAGTTSSYIGSNGSYLNFEVGSAERLRIDSSGNVGIGTSSPSFKLDVAGNARAAYFALRSNESAPAETAFIYRPATGNLAFGTASTERMRIDSSGNVGIGTDSPSGALHVSRSGLEAGITLERTTSATAKFTMAANDGNLVFTDQNQSAERMRIDASGNLLVGKTSADYTTAGVMVEGDGTVSSVKAGVTGVFNRLTSDGEIVQFRKDGSSVGSIATWDSDFAIGQVNVAFKFDDGGNQILPWSVNTNLNRDAAVDLGDSTSRWKDLYLSGGVYLGGTGTANKLDDYEEGTWTPTINAGTISATNAVYTKIGNLVTVRALIADFSNNTSTANIEIGGLPFTSSSDNRGIGTAMSRYFSRTDALSMFTYIDASTATLELYWSFNSSTAWDNVSFDDGTNANMDLIFTISYKAA